MWHFTSKRIKVSGFENEHFQNSCTTLFANIRNEQRRIISLYTIQRQNQIQQHDQCKVYANNVSLSIV